jgi:DNA-binding CsgD family transcriptional regulator
MHALAVEEIQGEEVIGRPGQNLTIKELLVLVGLADGNSPSEIGAKIEADKLTVRHLEMSTKAKLGAKTHPHMIARGFTLGVLIPRALCLLLAVLSVSAGDFDGMRNRSPRNGRAPSNHSRMVRSGRSGGRGGVISKFESRFVC